MVKDKNLIDYTVAHQERSDFFHSSGYATAQNGDSIGAAAGGKSDSFAARQALESQRQHIKSYQDSQVGNARWNGQSAKRYDRATDLAKIQSIRNGETTDSTNANSSGADSLFNRKIGGGYGRTGENHLSQAERRARFSAGISTPGAHADANASFTPASWTQPTLGDAKAPSIPSRRSGI